MWPSIPPETLLKLGQQYGLPLYVYHADVIDRQVQALRQAFHVPHLDIRYAGKALNTIGILRQIHQAGCGIDTVSMGEIQVALYAGIPPEKISFTPSGVLRDEYNFAIAKGIHVHVDQLEILKWLDTHYPGLPVTLRFNPGIGAGSHQKLQVGASGSKFGFTRGQLSEVKALTDTLSIQVIGVHMHLGSDISDSAHFNEAYDYLLSVGRLWSDTLQQVDVGGGFKVLYHPQDHAIDITSFGQNVSARFDAFCREVGRELTLILEPGKFLVSEAGFLLMETTGIRQSGETPTVYVSSGFNHFVRPMYYDAYHHIINLSHPEGKPRVYDIVGYLCETDTFATSRLLPEIRPGDVLCLMNAGAYGYTMASNYNSRLRPAEVLFTDPDTHTLIRRAETIEDMLQTDSGFTVSS